MPNVVIKTRKLTVGQIIDAMAKNGYQQITGKLIDVGYDKGELKIRGACAIGQVALNLGVDATSLDFALRGIQLTRPKNHPDGDLYGDEASLGRYIVEKNDENRDSVKTIARKVRRIKSFDPTITVTVMVADYTIYEGYKGSD